MPELAALAFRTSPCLVTGFPWVSFWCCGCHVILTNFVQTKTHGHMNTWQSNYWDIHCKIHMFQVEDHFFVYHVFWATNRSQRMKQMIQTMKTKWSHIPAVELRAKFDCKLMQKFKQRNRWIATVCKRTQLNLQEDFVSSISSRTPFCSGCLSIFWPYVTMDLLRCWTIATQWSENNEAIDCLHLPKVVRSRK